MAKKIDHGVLKKFAQGILDHLGDGESDAPAPPKHKEKDRGDTGKTGVANFDPAACSDCTDKESATDGKKGKGKKAAAMALLAANLGSKFGAK